MITNSWYDDKRHSCREQYEAQPVMAWICAVVAAVVGVLVLLLVVLVDWPLWIRFLGLVVLVVMIIEICQVVYGWWGALTYDPRKDPWLPPRP